MPIAQNKRGFFFCDIAILIFFMLVLHFNSFFMTLQNLSGSAVINIKLIIKKGKFFICLYNMYFFKKRQQFFLKNRQIKRFPALFYAIAVNLSDSTLCEPCMFLTSFVVYFVLKFLFFIPENIHALCFLENQNPSSFNCSLYS